MSNSILDKETVTIKQIEPLKAKEACSKITATLPEWFGILEANQRYAEGVLHRTSFAARINNDIVGMITLEFPFPNNANIFWMAVDKTYHRKQIGNKLLQTAENYCYKQGFSSLSVETLSPKQSDINYLNTYSFYHNAGFNPLFERYTHDPNNLMVYMQKLISFNDFTFIDLTHALSGEVPHWGIDVGFKYNARLIQSTDSASDVKFRVQRLEMSAGIGTHMDAPSHCFENLASIDAIPLQSLIAPCRVIDVSKQADEHYQVTLEDVLQFEEKFGEIPQDAFVIIYTGWSKRWVEPESYRNNKIFPSLSIEAAKKLLSRGIVGLGIDTLSPDAFGSDFPVHQLILNAGKYIIENVANADQLGPIGSFVFAFPIKVTDGTEAPIRLVGMIRKPKN